MPWRTLGFYSPLSFLVILVSSCFSWFPLLFIPFSSVDWCSLRFRFFWDFISTLAHYQLLVLYPGQTSLYSFSATSLLQRLPSLTCSNVCSVGRRITGRRRICISMVLFISLNYTCLCHPGMTASAHHGVHLRVRFVDISVKQDVGGRDMSAVDKERSTRTRRDLFRHDRWYAAIAVGWMRHDRSFEMMGVILFEHRSALAFTLLFVCCPFRIIFFFPIPDLIATVIPHLHQDPHFDFALDHRSLLLRNFMPLPY